MYDLVMKRQKEADLTQMLPVNNVRRHEEAVVPAEPIRPRVRLNLMLALFVGLIFGVAGAFVVDHLDNSLKSQEQVEQLLGLPFLGIVPAIKDDKSGENPAARDQYILTHPRSSVAECCRTVRTNLMFMSPDQPARSILVTSTGPREGKSTTVINLAITMAQSDARTLIVDTDMRRPRLHKTFGLKGEGGISSLILGGCSIEQAIQPSGIAKLDVLPCGPIPPNPAELLHTASFRKIVAELGRRYDRIIFDSPPVAAVSDALILTAITDGTVLVVNAGETTWPSALQAKRRIASVGGRIFGVVLNNVDLDDHRSAEYYQYYYYRSPYAEEDDKAATG
jgi:polysaccharide biosynthesis transport protein